MINSNTILTPNRVKSAHQKWNERNMNTYKSPVRHFRNKSGQESIKPQLKVQARQQLQKQLRSQLRKNRCGATPYKRKPSEHPRDAYKQLKTPNLNFKRTLPMQRSKKQKPTTKGLQERTKRTINALSPQHLDPLTRILSPKCESKALKDELSSKILHPVRNGLTFQQAMNNIMVRDRYGNVRSPTRTRRTSFISYHSTDFDEIELRI